MDWSSILLVLLLAVIFVGAILYFTSRRERGQEVQAVSNYAAGLNHLLSGEIKPALQKFRDAARFDTNLVDAYIKIGDILREHGNPEQAIKIHRELTVRTSLTPTQRLQILRSLTKDYQIAGKYEQALTTVQQILSINRHDLWARQQELALYERLHNWEKAFETFDILCHARGEQQNGRLALYRVQRGLQFTQQGREKDGRTSFREALKIDQTCAAAHLYLADSYLREERLEDALEVLKKFVKKVPQHAALAFDRLKDILYHIGEFGQIENIYRGIIAEYPDQKEAYLALAEIHEKKGELDRAIALCHAVLDQDQHFEPARRLLVAYYHKKADDRRAIEQALQLINEEMDKHNVFRCRKCGHESSEPFWWCPGCREWETVFNN